jgi:hypothetical protein
MKGALPALAFMAHNLFKDYLLINSWGFVPAMFLF